MNIIEFDIEDNQLGFQTLYKLQNRLYSDPYYLNQISQVNTEGFKKGFIQIDNGQEQSSVLLFKPELFSEGLPVLYFGHFEAENEDVGVNLMNKFLKYCRKNYPAHRLIGPVNSNTWGSYKLPLNCFESLFPGDIAGQLFYPDIIQQSGFEVFCKYSTNLQIELKPAETEKNVEYDIVYFDKLQIADKLDEICQLSLKAFEHSPLFQPIPLKRFKDKYLNDLDKLDLSLMPFLVDANQKIIAYLLAFAAYDKEILVVKTIARLPGRRYAGLGRVLSNEIVKVAISRQFKKIFHAFMNEKNSSNVLSQMHNGLTHKSYAVYYLDLL